MMPSSPTRQRSAMVIKQMREDKVPDLLNELLMFLTREKPSDPLQSLVDLLEAKSESERAEYATSTSSVLGGGGGGEVAQTTIRNFPPSPIGTPRGTVKNNNDEDKGVTVTNSNSSNIGLGGAAMPQACGSPIGMLGQRHNRAAGNIGQGKVSFFSDSKDKTDEKKKENGRESPSPNAPLPPPSGLRRDRTLIGATQTLGQDARRIVGLIERETERLMSEWGVPSSTFPSALTSTGTPLTAAGRAVGRLVRPTDADAVHSYEANANAADTNTMLLLALATESHYLLMDTLSDVSRRNEDVSTAMVVTGRSGGVGLLGGVMATAAAAALASLLDQEERENNTNNNSGGAVTSSATKKSNNMFDDIIGAGLGFGGSAQLAASGSDSEEDEDEAEGVAAARRGGKRSTSKKKNRPITINDAHSRTIRSTNMTNVTNSGPQSHSGNPSTAAAIKSINSTLTGGEVNRGGGGAGAHAHQPTTTYLLNTSVEDGGNVSSDGYGTPSNFFSFGFGGDSPYRSPRSARGALFGGGREGEGLFGEGGKRWSEIEDIIHDIYKEKDAILSLTSNVGGGGGEQDTLLRLLLEETNASVADILSTVDRNARLLRG